MTATKLTATDRAGFFAGTVKLNTHAPETCANDPACCIHKPSNHKMVDWPMHWRGDRGLMERTCVHGVGHPDPDDIAYKTRLRGEQYAYYEAVHGCDGCC